MENQVIYRDNQEMQAADLNNTQGYADDALKHLIQDAITDGLKISGGNVAAASGTEATVEDLNFYNAGKVYLSGEVPTLNLFQYLPVAAKKIVAVVVWGQETPTNIQPRDFLIDITTGATEPRAVAMTLARVANVDLLPGSESADPQPPVVQTGNLAIAHVYLTPAGIERIVNIGAARIFNLGDHEVRIGAIEVWKAQAEPRIASIATDLSALARKTEGLASRERMIELGLDVARLKEMLQIPEGVASYGADYFGDASESYPEGAGYACRIEGAGLLFPYAGHAVAPLALFNPYDAGIHRHDDNLVLPAYDSIMRIRTDGYSGDVSLSQYQVQQQVIRKYIRTTWNYVYGPHWNYYLAWYNRWYWKYHEVVEGWTMPSYGNWIAHSEEAYELEDITTSYNGVILAQSFLVSNAFWLTRVALYLTQVASSGDIHLIICEADGGKPVLEKTLAAVTVTPSNMSRYPLATDIEIPPILLEAGKRYAIGIITQGDHRAAVVSGNNYTQGTLFFGTDGDYFTGDLTKDLMFALYGAQFRQARTEAVLQAVSLSGGITDLAITAPQVLPKGTELRYELQVGGRWYAVGDPSLVLSSAPDVVPLRAVFLGTSDLAPGLELVANAVSASRPGAALVHWSTQRVLAEASTAIEVQVVCDHYDPAHHDLDCILVDGVNTYQPEEGASNALEPDGVGRRFKWQFAPDPGISHYKIKLTGSNDGSAPPFAITERLDIAS